MTEDFNHLTDDERPDDLAGLFQMYVDEVDEIIDAISDAETEARLAQLLYGTATATDIARDLVADVADSDPCLTASDARLLTQAEPGRHRQADPSHATQVTYVEGRLQVAMRDLTIAREQADAARQDASLATWAASVARVQAEQDTERAEAHLAEAVAYRNTAVERAGRIVAKARAEADTMMAKAQAEVEAAMARAQQIVADANALAEHIRVDRESKSVQEESPARTGMWAEPVLDREVWPALTTLATVDPDADAQVRAMAGYALRTGVAQPPTYSQTLLDAIAALRHQWDTVRHESDPETSARLARAEDELAAIQDKMRQQQEEIEPLINGAGCRGEHRGNRQDSPGALRQSLEQSQEDRRQHCCDDQQKGA